MASPKKIRIAVVGLNFGRCFVPLYQKHPDVEYVGVCDTDPGRLEEVRRNGGVERVHADIEEVIRSPDYDAIHLLTPVTTHGPLAVRIMEAGKHCACAVPMGLTLEELGRVVAAQERTGMSYMMMETAVYGRLYLYARELFRGGVLGRVQLLRGCHSQDLEHHPAWRGFPPMWYLTHAIAPLLDLVDTRATEVHCYGSGGMRDDFRQAYGNPHPIEVAIFALDGTPAKADVVRTLLETAPYGGETFDIYGDKATFATMGREDEPLLTSILPFSGAGKRKVVSRKLSDIPFRTDLLPAPLREDAEGGHGGSHPHLVHEFLRSIVEARAPYVHARRAANWCAPGICAHESAMRGGEKVAIPGF